MEQDSNPGGIVIGVFGKLPGTEPIKTRLRARLSQDEIERFYLASLADTLETVSRVVEHPVLFLSGAPTDDEHAGGRLLAAGLDPDVWRRVRIEPQIGVDLSARLANAFGMLGRERGAPNGVLIVGSDSPSLGPERLVQALAALRDADLVLGPATDGGYWAIGLRDDPAGLLDDVPWSTDRVLETTRARAGARGMRVELLETWSDVDVPADLEVLAQQITALRARGDAATARHTAVVLSTLGI